jgi:hypothetical protein
MSEVFELDLLEENVRHLKICLPNTAYLIYNVMMLSVSDSEGD